MRRTVIAVAAAFLAAIGPLALANDEEKLLEEARFVSKSLPPKLIDYIQITLKQHGTLETLTRYSHLSPKVLEDAANETGWDIRQVSLRNRNPKGAPGDWEIYTLVEFEKRLARGEPAINMYKGSVVTEDGRKFYRYMQPIMTQKICLECHGKQSDIQPEVWAKIREMYPTDAAIGYSEGTIRGAVSLKKPLK